MLKSRWLSERQVTSVARKKIVVVIVEGPSDDSALGVILNRLFDKNTVHVEIMYGDITTDMSIPPVDIVLCIPLVFACQKLSISTMTMSLALT